MRFFFFFKHKTAYDMRISDWSSDVCSSDLLEKGRDLDSALASQLINPTQWQEARTRLSDEIAALEKEMADSAVGQMFIPGIGMSNPIDLSPMFASAHNGLEEMA